MSLIKQAWSWLWPIGVGCLVAWAIITWVFRFSIVPSASMAPTIPAPSYIFVDHVSIELHSITRGEVVLFHYPDDPSQIFVKRVIGLPGDTVDVNSGHVYINGKQLSEPYLHVTTEGTFGPYKVPAGHYFMMGDNRNDSLDSRFWHNKYVAKSAITGRADFVLWPFNKMHAITQ